ncbi:MAG: NAD(P)-dependent oxidoreductase [Candidatus Eremiobacteraeota bacterium]|nr:NAD(P)-dependent oxidoreductase [Candidatus Eremiobacteraeota bacterium]MBC5804335.1 NAD(P)-dependent oxidoreductase [Candidatus Eremiobacteraeota bacterium]MBC5822011.1 NAD(P)-dependent oxidoreductase [Candidatus Eremiobacteraeota bacterium]
MIAWFGTGLLGAGFVRALRRRGEDVRVWNRTPQKARSLQADGAQVAADPADAACGAKRIHLTLSDDDAVDDVLERARAGFACDVAIVDHTTTSASGAAERVARWDARGIPFLHAPVFMGPQNALESSGTMLASGARDRFDALRPALEPMTGQLLYLGAQPNRAAAFKLMGNLFLTFVTAGLTDVLALAKALGLAPHEAVSLFDFFNPGAVIPARAARLIGGDFDHPSWELTMARKDVRLMLDEAQRAGSDLVALPAIAAKMDELIERGYGASDWTVMAKDALPA